MRALPNSSSLNGLLLAPEAPPDPRPTAFLFLRPLLRTISRHPPRLAFAGHSFVPNTAVYVSIVPGRPSFSRFGTSHRARRTEIISVVNLATAAALAVAFVLHTTPATDIAAIAVLSRSAGFTETFPESFSESLAVPLVVSLGPLGALAANVALSRPLAGRPEIATVTTFTMALRHPAHFLAATLEVATVKITTIPATALNIAAICTVVPLAGLEFRYASRCRRTTRTRGAHRGLGAYVLTAAV